MVILLRRVCSMVYCWTCLIVTAVSAVNEGHFFHISDFHYDPLYGNGPYPASSCVAEIEAADFPNGNYDCDSPWSLVEMTIKTMAETDSEVDFIVWTGDTPGALNQDLLDNATVLTIIQNVSQTIQDYFPDTRVFPALGNHDNRPRHLLQPEPNPFRDGMAEVWSLWMADYPGAVDTFKQGGYYVTPVNTNLWAIVLNTAFYYYKDTLTMGLADPAGQFAWLEETLEDADIDGKKVFIIAHILPGSSEGEVWVSFQTNFNEKYLEITRKYSHVIKGQFYGHHHFDSFRVLYDAEGTPINTLFVQPSVTPRNATARGPRNPSFRIMTYDRDTGDVIDIEQYYYDLASTNSAWSLEYRATESYEIPDLSPGSLHGLVEKFSGQGSSSTDFFQRYFRHNTAMAGVNDCNEECKRSHICAITKLDIPDYHDCLMTGSGLKVAGPIDGLRVAGALLLNGIIWSMIAF